LTDLPTLQLRLAELTRLRADYLGQNKPQFVAYVDRLMAGLEAEIAAARIKAASEPDEA
jgi:hypothetical protein